MPVPPQSEQSAAGFAALSMPASIALARRRFPLASAREAHNHSRGKVEMYVILWEFVVPPEKVGAFVAAYKSDGAWAKLFAQAEGYVGTELLTSAEAEQEAMFITIDRWESAEDFTRFQGQFGAEYGALDTQFEGLTVRERKLGIFISEV
jgi:hypothetical protein